MPISMRLAIAQCRTSEGDVVQGEIFTLQKRSQQLN